MGGGGIFLILSSELLSHRSGISRCGPQGPAAQESGDAASIPAQRRAKSFAISCEPSASKFRCAVPKVHVVSELAARIPVAGLIDFFVTEEPPAPLDS